MTVMSTGKKDTILYGGFFNPPTLAHYAILEACVKRAELTNSDVWVLPCGNRAHKTIDVSSNERLRLIKGMVADVGGKDSKIRIETIELEDIRQHETFDTAMQLESRYPDRKFIWVFGADSIATIDVWKKGLWLKDNLPMLIVDRPGVPAIKLGKNIGRLDVVPMEISSSLVRSRIAANESIHNLVGPSVLACLEQ